jgi:hypothetical protein
LPSEYHSSIPEVEPPVAEKYNTLLKTVKKAGLLLADQALISLNSKVPADVPSLDQSSLPKELTSFAPKYNLLSKTVK